jgi:hypothetical protein
VERRRCFELGLPDPRKLGDLDRQAEFGPAQSLEGAFDDIAAESNRRHLDDLVGAGLQAGRFDVDCYEH